MNEVGVSPDFRCGYVAIIGEPNVGKSTLMNGLIGQKLSIVTPKPQTTRHKILGFLSTNEYQIVLLDTPGIISPKYLLHEAMMAFTSTALEDADVVLFMIDATDPKIGEEPAHDDVLVTVNRIRKPLFLIINKSDLVKKSDVLPIIDFYSKARSFDEIFPISALKLEGTAELVKSIVAILPRHPPLYPLDIISEQNERFFVSEIIREKVFEKYQQEIPYSTTVEIVDFKEREGGKTFISANIHVERESQKGILIGRKGGALKQVGLLARKSIEAFLQQAVFLELHVKVQRDWRGDKEWLARLGYKHEQ